MQMQQRLQQMQQEILSRGSLSELIQRPSLDLYRKERARYPMEDVIQDMRNKYIRLQTVDVGRGGASAFTISFSYPDRFKAQAVVRELVTKFTEQNVRVQHDKANITSQFIGDEMKQAKERMDTLEQAVMKFKMENMGRLPEQFQANVAQLNTYQMMVTQANEGDQPPAAAETPDRNPAPEQQHQPQLLQFHSRGADHRGRAGAGAQREAQPAQSENHESAVGDRRAAGAVDPPTIPPSRGRRRAWRLWRNSARKPRRKTWKDRLPPRRPARSIKRIPNQQAFKAVQDLAASNNVLKTEMQNLNLQMDEKLKQIQELNRRSPATSRASKAARNWKDSTSP